MAKYSNKIKSVIKNSNKLLDSFTEPFFITDNDLLIQYINSPALAKTGYTREEVIGKKTCGQLCKTPICGTQECTLKNCINNKKETNAITTLKTINDAILPIKAKCNAIYDEKGKSVIGGIEYISDITLNDDGFLENMPDPVFRTDMNLMIQNINKAALDKLGFHKGDVVGKMTCADLCKTPLCGTVNCTIKKAMHDKKSITTSTLIEDTSGSLNPIRVTCGYLSGSDDKICGGFEIISFVDQVDEGFLANMADPAFRTDRNLVIQNINNAALNILGYTKEEVIGKLTCGEICKTPVCNTADCTIKKCIQTKGTIVAETTGVNHHGEKLSIRASCGILTDMAGEPVGGFEVLTDISPLMSMVDKGNELAKGNLTVKIEDKFKNSQDAVGQLANVFSRMIDSLNTTLSNIEVSIKQTASAADQVSQSSQSLSQSASEQASSLEEITATVQEISSQTLQNSDNANNANELSNKAMNNAKQGYEQMKELVTTMNEINKSAGEIKKIVKAIDDIAFQINLLALNANVEAARAGKYGKGFAVVADEVRNLAVRSANSVKETTSRVEEATKNIDMGNKLVELTAKQLEDILNTSQKVASLVEEIALASREQTQGVEQVNTGLEQIEQATQSTTANAEENASIAEELSSQAQELTSLMEFFKLSENDFKNEQINITPNLIKLIMEKVAEGNGENKYDRNISQKISLNKTVEGKKNQDCKQFKLKKADPIDPKKIILLDDDDFGKF